MPPAAQPSPQHSATEPVAAPAAEPVAGPAARTATPRQPRPFRGMLLYATLVCVLAVAASVLAFAKGTWLMGIVWVLLAGLTSNMAWYYARRARVARSSA